MMDVFCHTSVVNINNRNRAKERSNIIMHGHMSSFTRKQQVHTIQGITDPFSADHRGEGSFKEEDGHMDSEVGVTQGKCLSVSLTWKKVLGKGVEPLQACEIPKA